MKLRIYTTKNLVSHMEDKLIKVAKIEGRKGQKY